MSTWYDKVHLRLDWRPEATEHGRRQTRVSHSPTAGGPSSPIGAEVGVKRERYYGHPDDDSSGDEGAVADDALAALFAAAAARAERTTRHLDGSACWRELRGVLDLLVAAHRILARPELGRRRRLRQRRGHEPRVQFLVHDLSGGTAGNAQRGHAVLGALGALLDAQRRLLAHADASGRRAAIDALCAALREEQRRANGGGAAATPAARTPASRQPSRDAPASRQPSSGAPAPASRQSSAGAPAPASRQSSHGGGASRQPSAAAAPAAPAAAPTAAASPAAFYAAAFAELQSSGQLLMRERLAEVLSSQLRHHVHRIFDYWHLPARPPALARNGGGGGKARAIFAGGGGGGGSSNGGGHAPNGHASSSSSSTPVPAPAPPPGLAAGSAGAAGLGAVERPSVRVPGAAGDGSIETLQLPLGRAGGFLARRHTTSLASLVSHALLAWTAHAERAHSAQVASLLEQRDLYARASLKALPQNEQDELLFWAEAQQVLALLSRDGLLHRFAAAAADSWRQLRELLALAQRWECIDEQMYGLLVDAPRLAEAVAASEANAAKLLRLLPWQSDVLMEGRQTRNQTEEEQTAWVDALSVNRIRVVRIRFRNSVREHTIEW